MNEEKDKGPKGSTTNKIRKLHRQYNKILVDLFDQFAAESIEEALEKNEGSFGENIQSIVQCALDCLKCKVMNELGVKDNTEVGIAIGGIDLADGAGIMMGDEAEPHSEDETEEEHKEHEAGETSEEEAEEHKDDKSEKDEDDEDDEDLEESIKRNKSINNHRRGDLVSLTEAYTSIYKK